MHNFARIIEVKGYQVLYFYEYFHADKVTVLNQMVEMGGIRGNLRVGFPGPNQTADVKKYLAEIDEDYTVNLLNEITSLMHETETVQ